jgi:hypothetical protein
MLFPEKPPDSPFCLTLYGIQTRQIRQYMENFIFWHIQPLLCNDRKTNNENTAVVGSGPRAKMEELLEAVFSM